MLAFVLWGGGGQGPISHGGGGTAFGPFGNQLAAALVFALLFLPLIWRPIGLWGTVAVVYGGLALTTLYRALR